MTYNPGYKHCEACNIEYDGDECPSCNPTLYHVEIAVPDGPEDFTFQECGCNDCPIAGYWRKEDAIAHAKMMQKYDGSVRVCDENGLEV